MVWLLLRWPTFVSKFIPLARMRARKPCPQSFCCLSYISHDHFGSRVFDFGPDDGDADETRSSGGEKSKGREKLSRTGAHGGGMGMCNPRDHPAAAVSLNLCRRFEA